MRAESIFSALSLLKIMSDKKIIKKQNLTEALILFVIGTSTLLYSIITQKKTNIDLQLSPYLFPSIIACGIIINALVIILKGFDVKETENKKEKNTDWKTILIYIGIVIAYYIVMPFIGFVIANIILLASLLFLLNVRVWWKIALISVLTTAAIYFLFKVALNVQLPDIGLLYYFGD